MSINAPKKRTLTCSRACVKDLARKRDTEQTKERRLTRARKQSKTAIAKEARLRRIDMRTKADAIHEINQAKDMAQLKAILGKYLPSKSANSLLTNESKRA